MQYRELGSTGIQVSEIGFGTWGIGGVTPGATSYGVISDDDAIEALEVALFEGVNFFDTSNVYGDGHSEILLGQVLGETSGRQRSDVVISSKLGMLNYKQKLEMTADNMERSLDGSLERLQTDYLDVLHLHMVSLEELLEMPVILDTLRRFQLDNKVRVLAISLKNPLDSCHRLISDNFQAIQVNFSLLDMRLISSGFFNNTRAKRLGVLARTPLNFGFLAQNFPKNTTFDKSDHRSRWSRTQIENWIDGANQMFEAIGLSDFEDKQARSYLALKFCLSYTGISTVLAGMHNASEVKMNIRATEGSKINRKMLASVIKAYQLWDRKIAVKSGQML